jgi:hypothetical protein
MQWKGYGNDFPASTGKTEKTTWKVIREIKIKTIFILNLSLKANN